MAIGVAITTSDVCAQFCTDLKQTASKNVDLMARPGRPAVTLSSGQSVYVRPVEANDGSFSYAVLAGDSKDFVGMASEQIVASFTGDFWDSMRCAQDGSNDILRSKLPLQPVGFALTNVILPGSTSDIDEVATEYVGALSISGIVSRDRLLEDYISQLLHEITTGISDYDFRVMVLDLPEMNAGASGDGTITINSGLIAVTESSAELLAILAHEVAHVVLQHQQINFIEQAEINRKAERKKAWAALGAIALGAVVSGSNSEAYAYQSNSDALVVSLSAAYSSIAESLERSKQLSLMSYSREHESNADVVAGMWLKENGYDPSAMSSVLIKIASDKRDRFSSHGSRSERIAALTSSRVIERSGERFEYEPVVESGYTNEFSDIDHDLAISFLLSRQAKTLLEVYSDYEGALKLFKRLDRAGASDAYDYALMARAMRLSNQPLDDIHLVLDRSLRLGGTWLTHVERALLHIREGRGALAKEELNKVISWNFDFESTELIKWAGSLTQRLTSRETFSN